MHFYSMTSDSSQVAAGSSAPVLRVDGDVFAKQCQLVLLELANFLLRLFFVARGRSSQIVATNRSVKITFRRFSEAAY